MPLYKIQHATSLSDQERESLAQSITEIHQAQFANSDASVNVQFTDLRPTAEHGDELVTNRIIAIVQPNGPHPRRSFKELSRRIKQAWDEIVNGGRAGQEDRSLKLIVVSDSLTAEIENEFSITSATEDANWLENHGPSIESLAADGNGDAFFINP